MGTFLGHPLYVLSLVVLASSGYCIIPIDAVRQEGGGRKLLGMPAKCWSFVNASHRPIGTAWDKISSVAPVVQMRKLRLSKVEWFVQSQIASQDLNPGLPDKVLLWPLICLGHFLGCRHYKMSSFCNEASKRSFIILTHFPFHRQWNRIIFGSCVQGSKISVRALWEHIPRVIPKWNTSCQIFLDILTTCTGEGSKDHQLGNKEFLWRSFFFSRAALHHSALQYEG